MSFQAYLETIKARTGLGPDDFVRLAGERGLLGPGVKVGRVLDWLRDDYGLGRGHGMAIVVVLKSATAPPKAAGSAVDEHFRGARAKWREPYERLLVEVRAFGPDVSVGAGRTYLSLLRKGKKFGIVQLTGERLDLGLKLGTEPGAPYEPAGTWNSMVTHRLRVSEPDQLDQSVVGELRRAYELAGGRARAAAKA